MDETAETQERVEEAVRAEFAELMRPTVQIERASLRVMTQEDIDRTAGQEI